MDLRVYSLMNQGSVVLLTDNWKAKRIQCRALHQEGEHKGRWWRGMSIPVAELNDITKITS